MASALNGQWVKVLEARHYGNDIDITSKDLDSIVRNYRSRVEDAPVGAGKNWRGAKSLGSVEDLRRDGNSLVAKMGRITPTLENFYRESKEPPKVAVALSRTENGPVLQRIAFLQADGSHLSEDQFLDQSVGKDAFGNDEVIFHEGSLGSQWLEIFRSGDYGDKGNFKNSDLDQIVKNFDPSFHEPPAVIGHPEHDSPAYGWVDGLKRSGDKLLGKFKQIDPKFEEMVKSGRFKKRSIALYQTAKGWMLRHVGFLGAQPPEVKGLANATFSEDSIRFVTVTFGESDSSASAAIARLKRGGYWMPEFDRFKFPAMFAELEGSSALNILANFLERLQDECNIDPNASRLTLRAQNYARFHNVSFGEALDQVQRRKGQDATLAAAVEAGMPGARLTQLAYEVARSRGVSFSEALDEVAKENPELTH